MIYITYARYIECRVWLLQMLVDAGLGCNWHLQGPVQACPEVSQGLVQAYPEVCQVRFIQKKLYIIIKRMIYITHAIYIECQVQFLQMPVDAGLCCNWHLQGPVQACPEVCQVQFIQKKLYIIIKSMIYITHARYIECQVLSCKCR
jgi:hypothetical protein